MKMDDVANTAAKTAATRSDVNSRGVCNYTPPFGTFAGVDAMALPINIYTYSPEWF
jgi:hypothetical protein